MSIRKSVSLNFIIDLGVGKAIEDFLQFKGYDVISVRNLIQNMPDSEILKIGLNENRIVVTMDKDFGELVYNGKQVHSGVLLLRLEEATGVEKTLIMQSIIEKHAHDLSGNFSVFQNGKLRIKK